MAPLPLRRVSLQPELYIEKRYISTQAELKSRHLVPRDAPTVVTITDTTGHVSTVTLSPGSASTSAPQPNSPVISAAPSSSPSNGVVVGAIMGSFVGFLVLCVILYYCGFRCPCFVRSRRSDYSDSGYDSSRSSSDSESTISRIRVRRRGGGGFGFGFGGRSDRVRVGVRVPDRVKVRRGSHGVGSRSSTTTSERRRTRRVSGSESRTSRRREPLFGWAMFGARSGGRRRSEMSQTWYGGTRDRDGRLRFNVDD